MGIALSSILTEIFDPVVMSSSSAPSPAGGQAPSEAAPHQGASSDEQDSPWTFVRPMDEWGVYETIEWVFSVDGVANRRRFVRLCVGCVYLFVIPNAVNRDRDFLLYLMMLWMVVNVALTARIVRRCTTHCAAHVSAPAWQALASWLLWCFVCMFCKMGENEICIAVAVLIMWVVPCIACVLYGIYSIRLAIFDATRASGKVDEQDEEAPLLTPVATRKLQPLLVVLDQTAQSQAQAQPMPERITASGPAPHADEKQATPS